jgi:putative phage-type endonuclease
VTALAEVELPEAEVIDGAVSKAADAERWHDTRSRGIGGSDVAAILGQSPYRTALDVYVDKVSRGAVSTGASEGEGAQPGWREQEEMYWGSRLEPVVAAEFSRRELPDGHRLVRVPMLRNRQRPWQIANLDGLTVDEYGRPVAVLECKTTGLFNGKEWQGEEVPPHALLQLHHYLSVTGLRSGYVAALIGGQRFVVRPVTFDAELDGAIVQAEQEFWQRVLDRCPPEGDAGRATGELVRAMFPRATEDTAELSGELAELVDVYRNAHADERTASALKAGARDRLILALGPHAAGTVDGRLAVTFKDHTRRAVDLAWLRENHPTVYADACRAKPVRTFRLV